MKFNRKIEKKKSRGKPWWISIVAGVLVFCIGAFVMLAAIPAISPAAGAETADVLRSVIGPAPVAVIESVSFTLQDQFNQLRSKANGGQAGITFSQAAIPVAPTAAPAPTTTAKQILAAPAPTLLPPTSAPVAAVVADGPQVGWQAYGPEVNGQPVMARTMILLDPQRSYAGVALVRIDLSKLSLHLMAGTIEPSHPSGIWNAIPSLGQIPSNDQNILVAAFNGGFKGEHGHFGMMTNGFTLLPPIDGLGTIALYQDGHIAMGAWGTDLTTTPDMVAFRQNCPPLIDNGQINPALYHDDRRAWGYTGNSDITWRTGLGLTQDGKYLIYAVGNGTPASTLAEALQQAGAYNAMQLDIHQFYAHFYTYQPDATGSLAATRLLDQMTFNPQIYLTPSLRDFFYVTTR